jgi:hypothetical protein
MFCLSVPLPAELQRVVTHGFTETKLILSKAHDCTLSELQF